MISTTPAWALTIPVSIAIAVSQLIHGAASAAASESAVGASMRDSNTTPIRQKLLAVKRSDYEEQERQTLQADQEREARQKEEEAAQKKGEPAIPEGFGSEKPSLGVKLRETGPNVVIVAEIMPGSGAHGVLKNGDQILFIAGIKLTSIQQMPSIMGSRNFNEKIVVKILRNGEKNDVAIVLRQFTTPVEAGGSTAPSFAAETHVGSTPLQTSNTSSSSESNGPIRISANPTDPTPISTERSSQGKPITLQPTTNPGAETDSGNPATPAPSIPVGASTPPVEPLIPVGASTPSLEELEKSSSTKPVSGQPAKKAQTHAAAETSSTSLTRKASESPEKQSSTALATAPVTSTTSATSAGSAGASTSGGSGSLTSTTTSGSASSTTQGPTASLSATASGGAHVPATSSKEYLETEKKLTQSLIDTYLKRADVYRKLERFDASLDDYNSSIKIDAKSPLAYSGRGRTLAAMKKNKEAIAEFTNALQIDPNSAWDYTFRGMIYWGEKDFPKAIADFNKAIQLNPELHKAYVYRGNCYDSMGKTTEALADLTKAVQLDSKGELKGEPYKWRAVLYEKMGSERRSVQDKAKSEELGLLPMFD